MNDIENAIAMAQAMEMQQEVERRFHILERVMKGMEDGHIFVEFNDAHTVELALGGPGRRVDIGEPDPQGFYTPTVWVMAPAEVDEQDPTAMLVAGTGG